jgi:predicted nucleic acid-binding protein
MYLLDTNIVSELRRQRPNAGVVEWLRSTPDADLHLSAVTIGEIQAGIERTRAQDASKAAELESWLNQVAAAYNVHAMDAACFRQWARFMQKQSDTVTEDAMIAATAKVYGITVVTRNVRDFARFKVPVLNPFK